jgi:hypothetical protein
MKKFFISLIFGWIFLSFRGTVWANPGYIIDSFESKIVLEENSDLLVEEKIVADFLTSKRGIIRAIPWQYSARGKTINSRLTIISVTDEQGKKWNFTKSKNDQVVELKIGRENVYLTGKQTYVIRYRVEGVVIDYGEGPEIYWNVSGGQWDTAILETKAEVVSDFGKIEKTECFAGNSGSQVKNCVSNFLENKAVFESNQELGMGKELTIVAQISKNNLLRGPTRAEKIIRLIRDNWGYVVAIIPLLVMGYFWWKKGRDRRFVNDNVFYIQEGAEERSTKLFERNPLSTVYQKIEGLSPVQVGMIIDEKVDLNDVVAEIVDLARRGFLKIEKIEKKGIFGKADYKMVGTTEGKGELKEYQRFLLESIFGNVSEVKVGKEIVKIGSTGEKKISELKDKFYVHLPKLIEKVEESLVEEKCFSEKPSKTKGKWWGVLAGINFAVMGLNAWFLVTTYNPGPIFVWMVLLAPSVILASKMVAKTAKGYNYYRQAESLRWFIEKGKWREEIAEKKLFLSEVLPLAITLGVVKKLAKDMEGLGVGSPEYLGTGMVLGSDLDLFRAGAVNAIGSNPTSGGNYSVSGRSSWSGGSGFGGGSSGGGFGGGGGSSW